MVKKSRKIYILGSAIIALASLFLVYFLLISTGVVQVKNEIITITSGSIEATYNGEPVKCESVEVTQGELRKGHTIKAIYTGKVVNVGSAANTYTFKIVDSEGVDVTNKYTIEKLEGTITVNKRPISLRGSNAYKEYDGTPLSTNSKEYTWVSGSLIEGHTIEVSSHGEQTDAGIGENLLDVQIYDANRNVMTQNYDIQVVPGALTVNPIPLVISSGSANKRYDGTALTEDFWQLEHGNLLDLNEDGTPDHRIEAETNGTITEPGKADNTFKYIKVLDIETGNDVTHNYDIDAQHGVLEIKSVALVFKSKSIYKNYDGKPLVANKDDVELFSGELFEGHYYEVEMYELTEVNADKYDYEFKVVIKDQNGLDITDNYDVEYEYGKAEIKGADLAIKTGSDDKEYDGKPLSCEKYEIMSSEFSNGEFTEDNEYILENGDTLIVVDSTKVTDVSFDKYNKLQGVNNVIEFKVLDKNGNDVTKNYNIKDNLSYGTLTIKQKNIKIVTPSDSKEYDGTNLKYTLPEGKKITNVVMIFEETPLIDGHQLSEISLDTELTPADISRSEPFIYNVPTFKIVDAEGKNVTNNYSVSTDKYGKLSYSKKNITFVSKSDSKEYDGKPLTCDKYDVTYNATTYELSQEFIDENFLKNHTIEINNGSEITSVVLNNNNTIGDISNIFEVKIFTKQIVNGVEITLDVTELFSITKQYGKLQVKPKTIGVKTESKDYVYTGKEQEVPTGFTLVDDIDLASLGLVIKHVSTSVSVKNITSDMGDKNISEFEVVDSSGKKNPNYVVSVTEAGRLRVYPYPITLITESETFEYAGLKTYECEKTVLIVKFRTPMGEFEKQIDTSNDQFECVLGTGETLKISGKWSSFELNKELDIDNPLGMSLKYPLEIDILDSNGVRTIKNYDISKDYGYLFVSNPNYDYTIAPAKIAVPYSTTLGQEVSMYYALNNNFLDPEDAVIGIESEKIGTVVSSTYKLDSSNPAHTIINSRTSEGYSFKCTIAGFATTTLKKSLKIISFELFAPEDYEQTNNIKGTKDFRIDFSENDIVIYEHTVVIETKSATKTYDGTPLSGEDLEVNVTGLVSGHVANFVESSYTSITDVGTRINKVRIKIVDEFGNDVTDEYYSEEKFGTLNVIQREVSLYFDDPYVVKEVQLGSTAGVEVTEKDFEPETYQVFDLIDGHKLVSFSTSTAKESGLYEVTKFKIVDENGENVTKNYSLFADYIFIQIEYINYS